MKKLLLCILLLSFSSLNYADLYYCESGSRRTFGILELKEDLFHFEWGNPPTDVTWQADIKTNELTESNTTIKVFDDATRSVFMWKKYTDELWMRTYDNDKKYKEYITKRKPWFNTEYPDLVLFCKYTTKRK